MTIKTILSPFHNRTVKLGRKRSTRAPQRHVHLATFLPKHLPVAPPAANFTAKAAEVLADVMGNDQYGDCVFAGGYHIVGVATGNAGDLFHATQKQVLGDYAAVTGFTPNDPSTDNGAELPDAIDFWAKAGWANGTKALGSIIVDATDSAQVRLAIFLFEHLYMGVELPDAWINPFPSASGFTWDVAAAPDPSNGHCIMAAGYDTSGVVIDTWGMLGHLTWKALAKYFVPGAGGELHVILTPDMIAKGQTKAPNGLDWTALVAAFDDMGGNVPAPQPTPPQPQPAPPVPAPPPPAPVPPKPTPPVPTVGLKAAVDAVNTALRGSSPRALITRESAQSLATKALNALPRT